MLRSLLSVMLNCIKEGLPFSSYFLVFHRYHLIEINRVTPLGLLLFALLIVEPAAPTPKRLHMVPGAQLEVQCLQLILYLSVILAWTGAGLSVLS